MKLGEASSSCEVCRAWAAADATLQRTGSYGRTGMSGTSLWSGKEGRFRGTVRPAAQRLRELWTGAVALPGSDAAGDGQG